MIFQEISTQPSVARRVASKIAADSNAQFNHNLRAQQDAYKLFWFTQDELGNPTTTLRTQDEINAILQELDNAAPGQSLKLFNAAVELAELLLSQDPTCLSNDDWYPKYQPVLTSTTFRVV